MAELQFVDHHNMMAMLSKVKESEGFCEVLDFLRSSHISHALTVNPKIHVEHIHQFWTNAAVHGDEGNQTIRSLVHGKIYHHMRGIDQNTPTTSR